MKNTQPTFKGACCAMITPFSQSGALDLGAFRALCEAQIAAGSAALLVAGTTGEGATLTDAEQRRCIEGAVKTANGRVPVIAGAGSNSTAAAIEKTKAAQNAGADALLHITPYYNKGTTEGISAHFYAVADAATVPVILYQVPARTGVRMQTEQIAKIAQHPRIVGIKEASGDMGYAAELFSRCSDLLDIYCGCDDLCVPFLSLGGAGVFSVLSNLEPRLVAALCRTFFERDTAAAAQLQKDAIPLIRLLFSQTSPAPVKYLMAQRGRCENVLRLPLTALQSLAP